MPTYASTNQNMPQQIMPQLTQLCLPKYASTNPTMPTYASTNPNMPQQIMPQLTQLCPRMPQLTQICLNRLCLNYASTNYASTNPTIYAYLSMPQLTQLYMPT